jgi:hypothetical protein
MPDAGILRGRLADKGDKWAMLNPKVYTRVKTL